MAKQNKNNIKTIALVAVAAIVIIAIVVMSMGNEKEEPQANNQQSQTPPSNQQAQSTESEEPDVGDVVEDEIEEETTQPLYPDLCYAEGGTPRKETDGCREGEESIGEVPGFKVPYICCVS